MGAYERDRLSFLAEAHQEFGDVVTFDRRTTLVAGPALVREVLVDRRDDFAIRDDFLQQRIADSELQLWSAARRLLSPALRASLIDRFVPVVTDVVAERLRGRIDTAPFEAMPLLESITSEVMTRYYFTDHIPGIAEASSKLLEALSAVIGNPFSLPSSIPTRSRQRISRAADEVRAIIRPALERRHRQPDHYNDLASALIGRVAGDDPALIDRVTNVLMGSLLAGHRVPAAAVGWLLHLVAECTNLAFVRGLQDEARSFVDSPAPLSDFPIALAAVQESLRLFPPTWLMARTTTRETQVGEYSLAEGRTVLISPYVVHRDVREFERANEYLPERWLSEPPTGLMMPFGLGPRRCPGNHMAMATMTVALLVALGEFNVTPSGHPTPDPRTALMPRGLRLHVSARVGSLF